MTTTIGIILFENAEELDWAGPWEVMRLPAAKPAPCSSSDPVHTLVTH